MGLITMEDTTITMAGLIMYLITEVTITTEAITEVTTEEATTVTITEHSTADFITSHFLQILLHEPISSVNLNSVFTQKSAIQLSLDKNKEAVLILILREFIVTIIS
jgi:hypothetical protein